MPHRSRISPQEDERIPSVSKGKNGSDGGGAPPGCPTIFLIRPGAGRLLWNKSDGDQFQAVFDPLEPRRTEYHERGRKLRIPASVCGQPSAVNQRPPGPPGWRAIHYRGFASGAHCQGAPVFRADRRNGRLMSNGAMRSGGLGSVPAVLLSAELLLPPL